MLEELINASDQLQAALEHYLNICSRIRDLCLQGSVMDSIPSQDAEIFDQELSLVDSYESTLLQAKLAIKVTRNHTFSVSPISCLPPEILIRIFHMARDTDPHIVDYLPLIYSRWHSISLDSQSLWTHIYFQPGSDKSSDRQLGRAYHCHSRSGEMPLDFFYSADSVAYGGCSYDTHAENVCQLVAPRVRSLHLDYLKLDTSYNSHEMRVRAERAISTLLSYCTPGTFTKFVLNSDRPGFIAAKDDGNINDSVMNVNLQHKDLDRILAPITVLHLTGAFLQWKSHVYRGLVDLRLYATRWGKVNTISEAQLVGILKASPGLRILHFGLRIAGRAGEGDSVLQVCLDELEVLQVSTVPDAHFGKIGDLLRLLKPGPKPLHLSINCNSASTEEEFSITEAKSFFLHSNVTKLFASHFPYFMDFLALLPNLQVLILSHISPTLPGHSNTSDLDSQVTYPQLHACFLIHCELVSNELLVLTRRCRPQTLILYKINFYQNLSEGLETEIEEGLSANCSDVRITHTYPTMGEHRDLLPDR